MGFVIVLYVSLPRGLATDPKGAADLAPADTLLNEPSHLRIHSRPLRSTSDQRDGQDARSPSHRRFQDSAPVNSGSAAAHQRRREAPDELVASVVDADAAYCSWSGGRMTALSRQRHDGRCPQLARSSRDGHVAVAGGVLVDQRSAR